MRNFTSKTLRVAAALALAIVMLFGLVPAMPMMTAHAAAPEILEARLISGNMIELYWSDTGAASGGYGVALTGAGSSLRFTGSSSDRNNFRVTLGTNTVSQSSSTPYYWHLRDFSIHGVRANQHITTLRLGTNITSAQMQQIENGTLSLKVEIITDNVKNSVTGETAARATYNVINKPYYTTIITSQSGVVVKGSEFVNPATVQKAADMVDAILSGAPEALLARMRSVNTFVIFGPGEHSGNIPEQRNVITYDEFTRAEGYGGNTAATSAANVERNGSFPASYYPSGYRSGYANESILSHEFGHGVYSAIRGVSSMSAIASEVIRCHANAVSKGLWSDYARSNADEYFATMTAVWYNAMAEGTGGSGNPPANTRAEMYVYDRKAYDLFAKFYSSETQYLYSPNWANVPNVRQVVAGSGDPLPWDTEPTPNPTASTEPTPTPVPTPVPPLSYANDVTIYSGTTNFVIEGYGGASGVGGNLDLWNWWANSTYYLWNLVPDANEEYFQIKRQPSVNVLAPTGGAVTAGTRLTLAAPSATADNQWWKLNLQSNGRFIITNKANPELCITTSGTPANEVQIVLGALTAANNQWRISGNVPLERRIASVTNPAAINVANGTAIGGVSLPQTVTVTFADETTRALPVTWNTASYNGNTAGTYTLTGTIGADGMVTNPNNLNAQVSLVVAAPVMQAQTAPASNLFTTSPEVAGGANGSISGIGLAMEWSISETGTYVSTAATGLTAGTYYVRYKETDTHYASPATAVVVAAQKGTQTAPASSLFTTTPDVAGTNNGTITGITAAMEWSISETGTYVSTAATGLAARTYYVRYKETTNHNASPARIVTVAFQKGEQPAPERNMFIVTDADAGQSNGAIAGFDPQTMEWASAPGDTFKSDPLENLAAGDYRIRYKETANYNASPITTVTVGETAIAKVLSLGAGQGTSMSVKQGAFKTIALDTNYDTNELIFHCGTANVYVDAGGRVVGLRAGTSVITIRSVDGKFALSIVVKVV